MPTPVQWAGLRPPTREPSRNPVVVVAHDLGHVDDLAPFQLGVVRGLPEHLDQRVERGLDQHALVEPFVVGEGEPHRLHPEAVAAVAVLLGKPGATQRGQRAVDGGLGAPEVLGQLVQRRAPRIAGERLEHSEHAVSALRLGLTRLHPRATLP